MRKLPALLTPFMLAGLLLTGCAQSQPDPVGTPEPATVANELIITDSEVKDVISENDTTVIDGRIQYIAYGSSTCLPKISTAEVIDEEYVLTVADYGTSKCTRDLQKFKQTIERADSAPIPTDAKITINHPQMKSGTKDIAPL